MSKLLDLVKSRQMREDLPDMRPGDTVRVHARIVEGNKERIQVYEGVIIGIHRAQNSSTVTVRRLSHAGIGVERTFLLHSPRIDRFEVVRRGRVRRAKLYYLRDRQGKSARIKERLPQRLTAEQKAAARAARIAANAQTPAPIAETAPIEATPVAEAAPAIVAEAPAVEVAESAPATSDAADTTETQE